MAGLGLVLSRRNEAVTDGLRKGFSLPAIGQRIQSSVGSAIAQGRVIARGAGIARLGEELSSVGAELGDITGLAHVAIARDLQRAKTLATSYAERWTRKAEGDTVHAAANAANSETAGSLRRIGVTESAEAFNGGREQAVHEAKVVHRGHSLLKVWDATLDRRTCPICRDADGDIVGYHESFPAGTPGAVHPFCRCCWRLLTSEENGDQSLILPKEPSGKSVSAPAPLAPPAPVKVARTSNQQVAQLRKEGFSGGVPQSGLRPESFAHLRSGGAVYGGDVTLKIRADGGVQIVDGRHRITLARERGDTTIKARILVEGPRGGTTTFKARPLGLKPAAGPGEQQVRPRAVKR